MNWNRCDCCGKFISYKDFELGLAKRINIYPDSHYTQETYETVCKKCIYKLS